MTVAQRALGGGVVLAVLMLGLSLIFAIDAGGDLARKDACYLGFEFEVESAKTLRTSWFPPSATCEYSVLGRTEIRQEARWSVYFPTLPALALVGTTLWYFKVRRHTT